MKFSAKVRTAAIATVLDFVGTGMGHLYLGRARRFFIPLGAVILIVVWLGRSDLITTLPGFAVFAALVLGFFLFILVDSAVLGFRSGRDVTSWYARWFVLLGWFVLMLGVASYWDIARDWLGYGIYRYPGTYMRPTLTPEDIILTTPRVATGDLKSGTLVVFRHPKSGQTYVMRIKEATSRGTYSLDNGLPFSASLDDVPRRNITGLVKALIWSPERREFARELK